MSQSIYDRWEQDLDGLRRNGRLRTLTPPAGVDFSSNDYLGYARSHFVGRITDDSHSLSASGASSRLLRGNDSVWEDVESVLANWLERPAALVMNSGYVANEGLLSTIVRFDDWVASDQFNHASIIDGLRLAKAQKFIFRHNDMNHLRAGLQAASAQRKVDQQLFIVTEALFSMDGDRAPLRETAELADEFDAWLIVDEAHSTGCYGDGGQGLVHTLPNKDRILATLHTGGKALGVCGAALCGSQQLKHVLINRCRHLIYTTALPPIAASWWMNAINQTKTDADSRAKLHDNALFFRRELSHHGIDARGDSFILPVIIGDDAAAVDAARQLQEAGYDIRAIRPPSVPVGTSRLRISIHADHDRNILRDAAAQIAATVHSVKNRKS